MEQENLMAPIIRISHDEMEAYLMLPTRTSDQMYTKEEIMSALDKGGVRYGVDENVIDRMISEPVYGRELVVARGLPVMSGCDGNYRLFFNSNIDKKPTVREDGSVDYWSIHTIETVEEGQVIAKYVDPCEGKDGMTVTGKALLHKRGKPLPPFVGRGFEVQDDGHTFVSSLNGKIEKQGNRITILPIYELHGDVDLKVGNIDFRGDIVVHGNVCSGAVVKATGTITIDGTSEQCTIEAGKDIILRGGVLGGQKAKIISKGNIFAKFFEYAYVEAQGFIEADSALNSELKAYDKIFMTGRHATLIGGSAYGVRGLEVCTLGNVNEVNTQVTVGVHKDIIQQMGFLDMRMKETNGLLEKIDGALKQFDSLAREKNLDLRNDPRRVALMRTRIVKQAELTKDNEEYDRLSEIAEAGKGSYVRVLNEAYAGSQITIDDSTKYMKESVSQVEFQQKNGNIVMFAIADELV